MVDRAREATLAQDRDEVAERERLVELVRDEDHGLALLLQPVEHLRQLGDALWRQHRRRLVEDQHARAAPERLDDLDLLLVPEGEVDRPRVGVDVDAEQLGELGQALPRTRLVEPQPARLSPSIRFSSTVSAGISAECWWTVPIPRSSAVARGRDRRLDALDEDRAGVGAVQAGEDPDQRRLAGAVLAEQAVNLAPPERQVDPVVGEHSGEGLRDPHELDDRRVVRRVHLVGSVCSKTAPPAVSLEHRGRTHRSFRLPT